MKFIKRLFCRHKGSLTFVRNIYGDEIIYSNYARSIWSCDDCFGLVFKSELNLKADSPEGGCVSKSEMKRINALKGKPLNHCDSCEQLFEQIAKRSEVSPEREAAIEKMVEALEANSITENYDEPNRAWDCMRKAQKALAAYRAATGGGE